jgi:acyl dehydratase
MTTHVPMAELPALVGRQLGPAAPVLIDQARIDEFARCTLDEQWIHVDPGRAATGPFGATIGHGFLTLSLLSHFFGELLAVDDAALAINYGLDRVRFPAAVTSGSLLSATAEIREVRPEAGFTMVVTRVTMRAEGSQKPCCVADCLTRFVARAPEATT